MGWNGGEVGAIQLLYLIIIQVNLDNSRVKFAVDGWRSG